MVVELGPVGVFEMTTDVTPKALALVVTVATTGIIALPTKLEPLEVGLTQSNFTLIWG